MLAIASHLRSSGYRVTFITAEVFRKQIETAKIEFEALSGFANYDYRRLDDFFPERKNIPPGPAQLAHDMQEACGRCIPDQYEAIRRVMDDAGVDLIFADKTFMGTAPLLLGERAARPPIIGCGVWSMFLSSIDTSPFAPPDSSTEGRARNRRDNRQFQEMLQPVQDYMNDVLKQYDVPELPGFFIDCWYTLPDLLLQSTTKEFEYPRSDMPSNVRFVGPVLPRNISDFQPPKWWTELDSGRPVVLVTQGTVANEDFGQLIEPTLTALANENVLVVAATGRDPGGLSVPIPGNAIVERFIPFDKIFPKVSVFVTNGGYGAVHQSLSMGVPIVIAGTSEDKPVVAARVAWTGSGIDLKTDRPSSEQIHTAVQAVLTNGRYREKARRLEASFAQHNAFREITDAVASLIAADNDRMPSDNAHVHTS